MNTLTEKERQAIIDNMVDEAPLYVSEALYPYISEAMEIYANKCIAELRKEESLFTHNEHTFGGGNISRNGFEKNIVYAKEEAPSEDVTFLLDLLAANGGKIVSTGKLSVYEISQARASNRMYVDEFGLGFVWIPHIKGFPTTEKEMEEFEKWYPLLFDVPNADEMFARIMAKINKIKTDGKVGA